MKTNPGNRRAFTVAQIEDALRKAGGIQSYAAQILAKASGRTYSRAAMWERVQHDQTGRLKRVIDECKEELKDIAEHGLIKNIKNGETRAITYFLDRMARDRGYGPIYGVTGANGEALIPPGFGASEVHIYMPDNGRDPELVERLNGEQKSNGHANPNGHTDPNGLDPE